MNQDDFNIRVDRDVFDRRNGRHVPPPYLSDEGFVLIDRRASPDRRGDPQQSVVANMDSAIKMVSH